MENYICHKGIQFLQFPRNFNRKYVLDNMRLGQAAQVWEIEEKLKAETK